MWSVTGSWTQQCLELFAWGPVWTEAGPEEALTPSGHENLNTGTSWLREQGTVGCSHQCVVFKAVWTQAAFKKGKNKLITETENWLGRLNACIKCFIHTKWEQEYRFSWRHTSLTVKLSYDQKETTLVNIFLNVHLYIILEQQQQEIAALKKSILYSFTLHAIHITYTAFYKECALSHLKRSYLILNILSHNMNFLLCLITSLINMGPGLHVKCLQYWAVWFCFKTQDMNMMMSSLVRLRFLNWDPEKLICLFFGW